jgi:hypothetical protein
MDHATNLGKVFAHVISGTREIMAKRTGISRLARALTEELARYMGGIYTASARPSF